MTEQSEPQDEPTARARLWIGIIAGLMRAASRDLGPECPVGRRLADGADEAVALLAIPRPTLTLVPIDREPEPEARGAPGSPTARAAASSARRARPRTTNPG
ncbi:MAG: hypothetical protein QOK40_989 [Miltoncostaeaceae bacterium]|jgi:hypothetical protein|nr:hypothetical protein [Miltoncostaeaceae bacterium]